MRLHNVLFVIQNNATLIANAVLTLAPWAIHKLIIDILGVSLPE